MARVKEIAAESIREWERISAHSHITGLGLDGLRAKPIADGMVGQIEAREAAGLVVRLIKQGKFGGRAVLLVGPPGTGKCVSGDTPVLLANGCVKEIKEIYEEWKDKGEVVEKNENEEIIRVEGLKVVSLNPFNLKVEIKPVEYIYKQKIEEKILEVKLRSGRKIKVTKSHPLLTIKNGKLLFVESCKLKVGDYVAIPRRVVTASENEIEVESGIEEKVKTTREKLEKRIGLIEYVRFLAENGHSINSIARSLKLHHETVRKWISSELPFYSPYTSIKNPFITINPVYGRSLPIQQPCIVTSQMGEFFGYLISESDEYIGKKARSFTIRFRNSDELLLKRFVNLSKSIFKLNPTKFESERTKGIRISNWNLKEFLGGIGYKVNQKSHEKDIPDIIMKADDSVVSKFLRAIADGEGSVSDQDIEIATSSKKIANKLSYLLLRFGIVSRIREKKINNRIYYRIFISGNEFIRNFEKKIGFLLRSKKEKLKLLCGKKQSTNVDFIPNIQELLKEAREKLKISKERFYKTKNGYRYENGMRKISRSKLGEIVQINRIEGLLKFLVESDVFWDEIVDIREVEEKEVYDLCVKDNHTFIAGFGGIIVHNTALANAIAKELGKDVPFVQLAASEIFSTDIRKTEFLTQTLRKAIGVRIHEIRKVYEGVVKELEVEKAPHPYNPYQQIPVGAKIKIATKNESKTLKVDQSFAIQIYQQGIETGDIVQIDPELGRIVKLGKSEEAVKEKGYDITREKALPIPSGDVLKEKEFVYPVTLHSLDVAFAREAGSDIFSLFFGGKETKEIESEIRQQVDEYIKELVQQGKCELLPGVVFIDEVSMLDIETFAFLNRAMEQELCPILIFATNRGLTNVRGTDIVSPHGIPLDLLDRLLIINTKPYTKEEIRKILEIRAEKEKVKIEKEALDYLTQIGEKTSLRHAIQLLAPAYEVAKENKREKIVVEDIKFVEERFVDVKKSVEYMKSLEERFLK